MKSIWMVAILLATPPALATGGIELVGASPAEPVVAEAQAKVADWVVKQADHVSGVSSAHQITNPAKISYDSLMGDTSEMKELKRKGIRKDSARGQVLVSAAKDRVRRAAKSVMTAKGHCSVWKSIKSKSGKSVTDITEDVRKKLSD
jgi:hypothetical protein